MNSTLKLIGYVRYLDTIPTPVILIFGNGAKKYVQQSTVTGKVSSFEPMPEFLNNRFLLHESADYFSNVGSQMLVSIETSTGCLEIGTTNDLKKNFKNAVSYTHLTLPTTPYV